MLSVTRCFYTMISYDFATHSEQTAFIGLLLSVTKHAMSEHLYELKQISRLSIRSASIGTPFTIMKALIRRGTFSIKYNYNQSLVLIRSNLKSAVHCFRASSRVIVSLLFAEL